MHDDVVVVSIMCSEIVVRVRIFLGIVLRHYTQAGVERHLELHSSDTLAIVFNCNARVAQLATFTSDIEIPLLDKRQRMPDPIVAANGSRQRHIRNA